jgi:hypothetical protein
MTHTLERTAWLLRGILPWRAVQIGALDVLKRANRQELARG